MDAEFDARASDRRGDGPSRPAGHRGWRARRDPHGECRPRRGRGGRHAAFPTARPSSCFAVPATMAATVSLRRAILMERGYKVRLGFDGDVTRLPEGRRRHGQALRRAHASLSLPTSSRAPTVVVDALFGAGLARPIEGKLATLIERVNAVARARRRGRRAERHRRHHGRGEGGGDRGRGHRHLLPPEAGPSSLARPHSIAAR